MPARGTQKIKSILKSTLLLLQGSSKREDSDDVGAGLARLPVEILLHIGFEVGVQIPLRFQGHTERNDQVLRNPGSTLVDFKNLRLVCKPLDIVFAPVVLSSIHLFYPSPKGKILARCHQLRALAAASTGLSCVKTLTLHSWDWIFQAYGRYGSIRLSESGYKTLVKAILWDYVAVPIGYLVWTLYIDPTILPRQVRKCLARARARRYANHIDRVSLQLPSVHHVK